MKQFLVLPLLVLSYHTESSPKASTDLLVQQSLQEVESQETSSNLEPLSIADVFKNYDYFIENQKSKRSYKYIWVKMFPLTSTPYRDPFPVTKNKNIITLENNKGFEIIDYRTQKKIAPRTSKEVIKKIVINFSKRKIYFNKDFTRVRKMIIKQANKSYPLDITYPRNSYSLLKWDTNNQSKVEIQLRGAFVVDKTAKNRGKTLLKPQQKLWSVINVLLMDDYLKSVVPSEVPASWHEETLKAQAVAARTYALREMLDARNINRKWDVDPTTWFQSYRGVKYLKKSYKNWLGIEQKSTSKAVVATTDQIATYNSKIIKAYFSSNSGGITCSAQECFKAGKSIPYLKSIKDDPEVVNQPAGRWGTKAKITPAGILKRLVSRGGYPNTLKVKELQVLKRGPSGRVWRLKVMLNSAIPGVCNVDFINCDEIHLNEIVSSSMMGMFGPIRSRLYYLSPMKNGLQKIKGFGYGHGVGLSQYGAKVLAEKGKSWDEIIRFYYSGVDLTTLYQTLP